MRTALETYGVKFVSGNQVTRENAEHVDYLRAARAFTGMSQSELASAAGIDQTSVSHAERGRNLTRRTEASIRAALHSAGVKFDLTEERIVSVSYSAPKKRSPN
ncbi:helix-turn-helix transcriptional regulator [Rhizobium sp. L245/93]|nr:helix-turn-helix transcriptional regulator [Rhizobium sp. L245/93]MBO9170019.1 helix-turn-helix transcriptional regulator [Rhizobium sp. L245/93]